MIKGVRLGFGIALGKLLLLTVVLTAVLSAVISLNYLSSVINSNATITGSQDVFSKKPYIVLSVEVSHPRIRDLKLREGVYVYETAPRLIEYEGIYYEKWVYNVSGLGGSKWSVIVSLYPYLVKPNRTVGLIPIVERHVIDLSGVARFINYTAGNRTTIVDETLPPTTSYCIDILVAPPWFVYVRPGGRLTVRAEAEVPDPAGVSIAEERFSVGEEIVSCRSPSGRCFQVTSELTERFLRGGKLIYQRVTAYRFIIDAEYGMVVLLEKYVGPDLVSRISLEEWS